LTQQYAGQNWQHQDACFSNAWHGLPLSRFAIMSGHGYRTGHRIQTDAPRVARSGPQTIPEDRLPSCHEAVANPESLTEIRASALCIRYCGHRFARATYAE
jgi:hypothetical protein